MSPGRVFALALLTQALLIAAAWIVTDLLRITSRWGDPVRDAAIGLAAALTLAAINYLLLVHAPRNWIVDGVRAVYAEILVPLFAHLGRATIVLVGIAAGIGEEWLFRGVLQHVFGLIPASLVFGLAHVGGLKMLPFGVWAMVMGLALGGLAIATGGLIAPIVAHGVYDMLALEYIRRDARRQAPGPRAQTAGTTRVILCVVMLLSGSNVAYAQQRPLVTEDPETIGAGRLLIEAGLEVERDVSYPVSGLTGNRFSFPTFGVSVGLSSIAELQLDGSFYQRLAITDRQIAPLSHLLDFDGDETHDLEDFVLATKVRLFTEGTNRPAVGLRFATRLPNASNESGLGHDMTDFFASLLLAKTVQSIRIVANGGVAILGDPTAEVPEQNDLVTFGLSVARAMTSAAELVGEINGRLNLANGDSDPGAENRARVRLGGRYTRGSVRVDAGVSVGLTSVDPQIGATAGVTWVLNAFRLP